MSQFNRTGIFVTLSHGDPRTDEVVGILPDGIGSVAIRTTTGATRTMDVAGNVVRFLHRGATSAELVGPEGAVVRPIAGGLDE